MSIEGIIASIVMFLMGVVWVVYPIFSKSQSHAQLMTQQDHQSLLNAYERLLARLRDLDEDFNLGKMPPADYEIERAQLTERGASLLAQIESALQLPKGAKASKKADTKADADLDAAIESAIANYVTATATQEEKEHA